MSARRSGRASVMSRPRIPRPFGRGPIAFVRLLVESDGDELRKARPSLVEHSECAVPGIDECHRGLDDAAENRVEVEVGPDGEHRIEQLAEAARPRVFAVHALSVCGTGHDGVRTAE